MKGELPMESNEAVPVYPVSVDDQIVLSLIESPGPADRVRILRMDPTVLSGTLRPLVEAAQRIIQEGRALNIVTMIEVVGIDPFRRLPSIEPAVLEQITLKLEGEPPWREQLNLVENDLCVSPGTGPSEELTPTLGLSAEDQPSAAPRPILRPSCARPSPM